LINIKLININRPLIIQKNKTAISKLELFSLGKLTYQSIILTQIHISCKRIGNAMNIRKIL